MCIINSGLSIDLWQFASVFLCLGLIDLVSLHAVFVTWKIIPAEERRIDTDQLFLLEINILFLKYPLLILKLNRVILSISKDTVHLKLFGIGWLLDLHQGRINVLHLLCLSQFLLVVMIFTL